MEEFIEQFSRYPNIQTFLRDQTLDYDTLLALSESSSVGLADKFIKRGLDDIDSMRLAKKILSSRKSSIMIILLNVTT